MGQRLDRPSAATNSSTVITPNAQVQGAVSSSLSTTFSSSSASSTSSSSSNTSAPNNNNGHRTRRSQDSAAASGSSSAAQGINVNTANMSPRSRFRAEMSRRGYTNSSSDLFFRLFQFPNQVNTNSSTLANSSSQTASESSSNVANITPLPLNPTDSASSTPTPSNVTALPSTRRSGNPTSSGLSAFRFLNIGGNSNNNTNDLDSDLSTDEDEPHWNTNQLTHSLPFFFGVRDFKCFVCSKTIPADDVEAHIMMCLTKPRLTYNDDVLTDDKGECIICFEELEKGQKIARLQCLCIYHKHCIESWLERSQTCPGHPPD